jgi:hypothetical protein
MFRRFALAHGFAIITEPELRGGKECLRILRAPADCDH